MMPRSLGYAIITVTVIAVPVLAIGLVYAAYRYIGIEFIYGILLGVVLVMAHYRVKHGRWPDL